MDFKLNYKNRELIIEDVKRLSSIGKFIGLMFCRRKKAQALLFEFRKPTRQAIHSLFVFFEFVAIWLDSEGKIVDLKFVKPWEFIVFPKKDFVRLIEIPLNEKYKDLVQSLVGY